MSRSIGVLMKRELDHAVFLTTDGRFIKGRSRVMGAEVGQEVEFVPVRPRITDWVRLGAVAVLMIAILVSGLSVFMTRPVIAAYITIDINPSLELGIDRHEIVRSAIALNKEAEMLIATVELIGRPVTEALEMVMATATEGGFLEPESEHLVVITTIGVNDQHTNQEALTAQLDTVVRAMVAEQEHTVVSTMIAPPEAREEARKQGVSVGRLLVAQKAEEAGVHLDPVELKSANLTQSIRAAGGDLGTILKKNTGKSDDDGDQATNMRSGIVTPEKGNLGNGNKNKSNVGSILQQRVNPPGKTNNTSKDKGKDKGQDKGNGNNGKNGNNGNNGNNGKNGQAPGQSKR